jgi:uncharacterized protein (DUF924 family)
MSEFDVDAVLDFWFGREGEANYGKRREIWFAKNPDFDQQIRNRFMTTYEKALAGDLVSWANTPRGSLALIIAFDQFPRNIFRNTPQAFATDSQALSLAQQAVNKGFDRELIPVQRWFIYLPFTHSENLEHQQKSVNLFRELGDDSDSLYITSSAIRHLEIIERFGRFPHRNAILGRATTLEEEEFLKQPKSSF